MQLNTSSRLKQWYTFKFKWQCPLAPHTDNQWHALEKLRVRLIRWNGGAAHWHDGQSVLQILL